MLIRSLNFLHYEYVKSTHELIKWKIYVRIFKQIPPGKLEVLTLKLSVLDTGRMGKNKQLIGHVILPLSELEGVAPDEEPQLYKLDIEKVSFCHENRSIPRK